MNFEKEIKSYMKLQDNRSQKDNITFLIKLWKSPNLKCLSKYDIILQYFVKNLLTNLEDEDVLIEVGRFLSLKHPPNSIRNETKKSFVKAFRSILKDNPKLVLLEMSLDVISHESLKDFFKDNLELYFKFTVIILNSFKKITTEELDEATYVNIYTKIIREINFFSNLEGFQDNFLNLILAPLNEIVSCFPTSTTPSFRDLLWRIIFNENTELNSNLEVFNRDLNQNCLEIILECFLSINKFKTGEILKVLKIIYKNISAETDNELEFLNQTQTIFKLLLSQGIELHLLKRQDKEFFDKWETKIFSSMEEVKNSMEFCDYLGMLETFIACDAFLFSNHIFGIVVDCMIREKSTPIEMSQFEQMFALSINIYAKNFDMFLKKLLKTFDEKLDSVKVLKKRKRKSATNSNVSPKKQKLSNLNAVDIDEEWKEISDFLPISIREKFSIIISGLNAALVLKVWDLLCNFLSENLMRLKECGKVNDNYLIKIDFACFLFSELLNAGRIHEQLAIKVKDVTQTLNDFESLMKKFYDVAVNIEYNNRIVNSLLRMSCSYENFLMLYLYHHKISNEKLEISSLFTESHKKFESEWNIIQQRVRNFGENTEKNNLNVLIIKLYQKNQLFGNLENHLSEDISAVFKDGKQVEFLLKRSDTRFSFINLLKKKEIDSLVKFLLILEDEKLKESIFAIMTQNQALFESCVGDLLECIDGDTIQEVLKILHELPLDSLSDDNKKEVFRILLDHEHEAIEKVLEKLFKNESFKNFFKYFSMKEIIDKLSDIRRFEKIFVLILNNTAKRMNEDTLKNYKWIIESKKPELVEIFGEVILSTSISDTPEYIKDFKINFISTMIQTCTQNDFIENNKKITLISKLYNETHQKLSESTKSKFETILEQILITSTAKSSTAEHLNFLLAMDIKNLNLSDEMKKKIIDALLVFLKSLILQKMSSNSVCEMDYEEKILKTLKIFEGCQQESYFDTLRKVSNDNLVTTSNITIKPSEMEFNDFFKFGTVLGEALFLIANVRRDYFKSRIVQYFEVYIHFLELIYFYKNDDIFHDDANAEGDVLLLLQLAHQTENILNMIFKTHESMLKNISPFIASSVVNILVKNPKSLSINNKFKRSIRNVCCQLLSTFDDNIQKHVYSVADEMSREIYDNLFMDIHRKS
ncbi:CLUMA_CG012956, isoform A [Clunio marinus]|uniref:CLUMA_CG012956, isoform A n=1 Tax=Clunio marinus TaxID=568069 RepID=A0A1J1IHB9_9DIPT|nr:CLUMA_CG012956, isoform A [Clunio marinus]